MQHVIINIKEVTSDICLLPSIFKLCSAILRASYFHNIRKKNYYNVHTIYELSYQNF
jgi:hypothetical protein